MELQNCIDVVEKLLRQNNRKYKDSHEQLLYERGYLTGLLARLMNDDPHILNKVINKTNHRWLVETVRFELTVHVATYDRLATCCLRPLGHVSYVWCLHLDSNQEPSDYESLATNQLCYRGIILWCDCPESNRDAVKREILSLLCLPISPQSQIMLSLYIIQWL